MAETDPSQLECSFCGNEGLYVDDDGHFYCTNCNSQADGIFDKANADEDFLDKGNFGAAIYSAAHKRSVHLPPPSSFAADTHFDDDHVGPIEPADFGVTSKGIYYKEEDYYNTIRMRYVLGVQLLIQFQCEALVDKCGVNPLICGISASIWMRFLAFTRVFADDWADKTVLDSEIGEKRCQLGKHVPNEPRNMHNERMVIIWFKSLKKRIPLSHSLAISYLACHVAKEPILPTDIIKWAIEGKLPYFGAFPKIAESIKKIEKYGQYVSVVCPLKASSMFSPSELPLQKLESLAASIAQSVGLSLPPVNFYRIAYRYLKKLSLPVEKIIPYACRIQEWSMPPDLWLSTKEGKLPTRVCVMSILIVAIRILYNLNGFGKWEKTLSAPTASSSMDDQTPGFDKSNAKKDSTAANKSLGGDPGASSPSVHIFESDSAGLLHNLEKRFDELNDIFEYSKDLPTYLQYCKDVVFAGIEPLYKDPTLIEELWDFYEKNREPLFEAKMEEIIKKLCEDIEGIIDRALDPIRREIALIRDELKADEEGEDRDQTRLTTTEVHTISRNDKEICKNRNHLEVASFGPKKKNAEEQSPSFKMENKRSERFVRERLSGDLDDGGRFTGGGERHLAAEIHREWNFARRDFGGGFRSGGQNGLGKMIGIFNGIIAGGANFCGGSGIFFECGGADGSGSGGGPGLSMGSGSEVGGGGYVEKIETGGAGSSGSGGGPGCGNDAFVDGGGPGCGNEVEIAGGATSRCFRGGTWKSFLENEMFCDISIHLEKILGGDTKGNFVIDPKVEHDPSVRLLGIRDFPICTSVKIWQGSLKKGKEGLTHPIKFKEMMIVWPTITTQGFKPNYFIFSFMYQPSPYFATQKHHQHLNSFNISKSHSQPISPPSLMITFCTKRTFSTHFFFSL